MPVSLAAKLRRSHFLFLGYDMADWNLRLILNRIWGERPVGVSLVGGRQDHSARSRTRSGVVTTLRPLDVEPGTYVELLERRLENAA